MSLQRWAERLAATNPGDSQWIWRGRRRQVLVGRLTQLAEGAELELTDKRWGQFAATVAFSAMGAPWETDVDLEELQDLLVGLEAVMERAAPRAKEHYGTWMFWELVASGVRELDSSAWPGPAYALDVTNPEAAELVFEALARQVRTGDLWVQKSALLGLSSLGHPGTRRLIDEVMPTLDVDLRGMAAGAAEFALRWPSEPPPRDADDAPRKAPGGSERRVHRSGGSAGGSLGERG